MLLKTEDIIIRSLKNLAPSIPAPAKRRLYLQLHKQPQLSFAQVLSNMFTWRTVTAGTAAVVIVAAGTIYAATSALPGSPLFALRRAYENQRLRFAANTEARLQFEIDLASQRAQDAQQVLAQNNNPDAKSAAIAALNNQTAEALTHLKSAAQSNISIAKDTSLLNKAETLANTQQQIVASVDPAAAKNATQQSQNTIAAIKQIVAASNEQTSASLPVVHDFDTSGQIVSISAKTQTITVDKNIFYVTSSTNITDKNGTQLSFNDLNLDDQIAIKGTIADGKNITQSIAITQKAKIEHRANSTAAAPDSSAGSGQQTSAPASPNPQDTIGTFIPETPASTSIH